jgi:hypothetical protein
MPILNKIIITEDGLTFNRIEGVNPYYFCTHDTTNVLIKTDYTVVGKTDTLSDIFGTDTYEEMIDEIKRLGLIDNE